MTAPNSVGGIEQYLRTLRIVNVALVMGVLPFVGIDIFMWAQGQVPVNRGMEMVSYMAAGTAVLVLIVHFVVMAALATAAQMKLRDALAVSTRQLMELYGGRMIIGSALLEGKAFFFLVAFMTDGKPWALAGGLAFAALIAVLHFPTLQRVEAWIATMREALERGRLGM
jgi:hypothetical protein